VFCLVFISQLNSCAQLTQNIREDASAAYHVVPNIDRSSHIWRDVEREYVDSVKSLHIWQDIEHEYVDSVTDETVLGSVVGLGAVVGSSLALVNNVLKPTVVLHHLNSNQNDIINQALIEAERRKLEANVQNSERDDSQQSRILHLANEIEFEKTLLKKLGGPEALAEPKGYRYIGVLLYKKIKRDRGEEILKTLVQMSSSVAQSSPTNAVSNSLLIETPLHETYEDCFSLPRPTDESAEQTLAEIRVTLGRMAATHGEPASVITRTTCYDFDAVEKIFSNIGISGTGPILVVFDGKATGLNDLKQITGIVATPSCPRPPVGAHIEALIVKFRRDVELDAAILDAVLDTLASTDCQTPWLSLVRLEILDTFVRGSRITKELASEMIQLIGVARASMDEK
jgi:hypothetical protein